MKIITIETDESGRHIDKVMVELSRNELLLMFNFNPSNGSHEDLKLAKELRGKEIPVSSYFTSIKKFFNSNSLESTQQWLHSVKTIVDSLVDINKLPFMVELSKIEAEIKSEIKKVI